MDVDDEIVEDDRESVISEPEVAKKRAVPWVEKYRPTTVATVSHQKEVIRTLETAVKQGNLPHLLFHGPPGTGKTTTILALARELYGPDLYKSRILELNASDDRGISVVREKIKSFAQGMVGSQKAPGYPCPRFKIIILDEADTMTPEAQSALRRIMEAYSKVTRFCLVCNYVTRVIEPLASRCAKFRFKPLPSDSMIDRIKYIAECENVKFEEGACEELLRASEGDMRRALTCLQSCSLLCSDRPVDKDTVIDISGVMPSSLMTELWTLMCAPGGRVDPVRECVSAILCEGYPLSAILPQLLSDLLLAPPAQATDLDKALIAEKIAQADLCLMDGADETLQLMDVACFITRRISKNYVNSDSKPITH